MVIRAPSSSGRALLLQSRGKEFESPGVHTYAPSADGSAGRSVNRRTFKQNVCMFTTYVIQNSESSVIYIGQTADLDKRLKRHNGLLPNKATSFTSRNKGTWKLIYSEVFSTRKEAMKREKELKSSRGRTFIKTRFLV